MNDARTAACVAALAGLFASLGCGGAPVSGPGAPPATDEAYDSQACVETALRRSPDPATLGEAYRDFSAWCGHGDSASCSTLGVIFELGLGVPRDAEKARALYDHACAAGNARACENLGELTRRDGARTVVARATPR